VQVGVLVAMPFLSFPTGHAVPHALQFAGSLVRSAQ
jgi:hypothetical protein